MLFRDRLAKSAEDNSPIILAADLPAGANTVLDIMTLLDRLQGHICAIKMNMQILLPLGMDDICRITSHATSLGLQCVADIKLNDIGNTNTAASHILWEMGFDALIANPIMGPSALLALTKSAHQTERGVISICHMSSYEGAVSYEMQVGGRALYNKFLTWGISAGVDGMIVGATFPHIIAACHREIGDSADIISPGIGVQGGSAVDAFANGSDYIIVGRSLLESKDPVRTARSLLAKS